MLNQSQSQNQNSRGLKRSRSPDTYDAPAAGTPGDDGKFFFFQHEVQLSLASNGFSSASCAPLRPRCRRQHLLRNSTRVRACVHPYTLTSHITHNTHYSCSWRNAHAYCVLVSHIVPPCDSGSPVQVQVEKLETLQTFANHGYPSHNRFEAATETRPTDESNSTTWK